LADKNNIIPLHPKNTLKNMYCKNVNIAPAADRREKALPFLYQPHRTTYIYIRRLNTKKFFKKTYQRNIYRFCRERSFFSYANNYLCSCDYTTYHILLRFKNCIK
jgi:hypothetical protein